MTRKVRSSITAMISTTRRVAKASRILEAKANPNTKVATGTFSWPHIRQMEGSCVSLTTHKGARASAVVCMLAAYVDVTLTIQPGSMIESKA